MHIKEKLKILKDYYDSTRQVGHTTLMKKGTKEYNREKLVLVYSKKHGAELEIENSESVSWNNLDALKGYEKPLAIDNSIMQVMLEESLDYISELEMYKEKLIHIQKIIQKL